MGARRPLEERFWEKVSVGTDDVCWNWQAATNNRGYGVIGVGPHSVETTHRVSWTLRNGSIPDGLWVLHHCDNRRCVNPLHLYLGTIAENTRDAVERGRIKANIDAHMTPEVEARRVARLPRGARHHRSAAKLSATEALAILMARGSQRDIAAGFGVTQQCVSNIKLGKAWGWIYGEAA
jgi:hypothetical protein